MVEQQNIIKMPKNVAVFTHSLSFFFIISNNNGVQVQISSPTNFQTLQAVALGSYEQDH